MKLYLSALAVSIIAVMFIFQVSAAPQVANENANAEVAAESAAATKPIKALLITGGCCHDYNFQAKTLIEHTTKHVNIEWTVVNEGGKGTKAQIKLYEDPNWAKKFDVVVHNECFANTTDADYIRRITEAHKAGVPAVVIHCAMHTYRAAKIDDWREFLGVTSFHHEHQAEYPVVNAQPKHPVMIGYPADGWTTPKDELYVVQKLWPNATALATTKSERNGKVSATVWVNEFGKARVFGTTWGHGNATWKDEVYLDLLTRGTLWAAGRLGDDGKPKPGYGAKAAAE